MFNKINCDRGAIDDMLGAQTGVSDENMIQYLGIIEQRTNELLAVKDYQASKVRQLRVVLTGRLGMTVPPLQRMIIIAKDGGWKNFLNWDTSNWYPCYMI